MPAHDLVLGGGAPQYTREYKEPAYLSKVEAFDINTVEDISGNEALESVAKQMIALPNIASKRWIYVQYDSMVGAANTSTNAPSDAAVVLAKGTGKALGEVALVGNPLTAPLALSDPGIRKDLTTLGKSMIDYDDFKNGHPFRGLGYDTAQVATFFLPGAGEAAPAADAAGGGDGGLRVAGRHARAARRQAIVGVLTPAADRHRFTPSAPSITRAPRAPARSVRRGRARGADRLRGHLPVGRAQVGMPMPMNSTPMVIKRRGSENRFSDGARSLA